MGTKKIIIVMSIIGILLGLVLVYKPEYRPEPTPAQVLADKVYASFMNGEWVIFDDRDPSYLRYKHPKLGDTILVVTSTLSTSYIVEDGSVISLVDHDEDIYKAVFGDPQTAIEAVTTKIVETL